MGVCVSNVFDVDVVAGLFPAAVYRRGLTTGQIAAEDRHDPRFSVGVLPGPVDVGVAERDVGQAELDLVVVQVALARELGDPVGGDGVERVILGGGKSVLLAVYGPARGGEDDLPHAAFGAVLEEAERSEDVDVGVEIRLPYRASHVHLGGLVAEGFGPEVFKDLVTPRADVGLVELRPSGYVLALARREVVYDGDFVSASEQVFCYARSDKPGPPGQEHPHLRSPRRVSWTTPRTWPPPETRTNPGSSRGPRGPPSAVPSPALPGRGLCRGSAVWDRPRGGAPRFSSGGERPRSGRRRTARSWSGYPLRRW